MFSSSHQLALWPLFSCSVGRFAASPVEQSQSSQEQGGMGDEYVGDSFMVVAVAVLICAFWVVLLLTYAVRFCRTRRGGSSQPPLSLRSKAVTADIIEQRFPVIRIDGQPMCVVCLSPVEAEDPCRTTQCGHTFHAECILEWWMHKPRKTLRCPICRQRQRKRVVDKQTGESGELSPNLLVEDVEEGVGFSPNISEPFGALTQIPQYLEMEEKLDEPTKLDAEEMCSNVHTPEHVSREAGTASGSFVLSSLPGRLAVFV
jgi:hypothetical protein